MDTNSTSDGPRADRSWSVIYRTSVAKTSAESMSLAVVEAIEKITGKQVTEIGPLQCILDSEALDNLFSINGDEHKSGPFPGFAAFEFEGFLITVHGTGDIVVYS